MARPLVVQAATSSLELRYSGQLGGVIDGVNELDPQLVELAVYSAWYPIRPDAQPFTYEPKLRLPRVLALAREILGDEARQELETMLGARQWPLRSPAASGGL